jgi:peptide/nickel transport system ATP-binding protein/oligopeptide transport system ATP-binding protein
MPFVQVTDLRKTYQIRRGLFGRAQALDAVAGVSFEVEQGSTFGLVGESGSGKSTIAKLLMMAESPSAGTVIINGRNLASMNEREKFDFRKQVQPVLQDPYSALNPRMRIGRIIDEPLRIHKALPDEAALNLRVSELLDLVGLPRNFGSRFPHELSGGQRQRVSIARTLGVNPSFMILDEPVSALDVSIQAQILNLLKDLQDKLKLTYLLISHDLAVVAYMSQRVGVLYLGQFMEIADTEDIVSNARHPYTQALLASVNARSGIEGAIEVSGEIPSPMNPPSGCPFHPRCPMARERCASEKPLLRELKSLHWIACHFAEEIPPLTLTTGDKKYV